MIIISANKKRLRFYLLILLTALISPFIIKMLKAQDRNINNKYIALVIDDFGNNTPDMKHFLDLEVKFTGAVMPGLENSEHDMLELKRSNKEIILHMPMEPHHGKKSWLGPNCLLKELDDSQIKKNITNSLDQIKFAVGLNNHMGSKIMEDQRILDILFDILSQKKLLFLDSKTTPNSKAQDLAKKYNLKVYERDVFIDNKDITKVKNNLLEAIDIASKKNFAIAIGHVGPAGGEVTARAIKQVYDQYKNKNIRFVTLSELSKLGF